jgi:hypothetical protein
MQKYSDAIEPLKRQVANLPQYPHVARIREDIVDMESRLSAV